jgi:hypothetical protein
MGGIGGGVDVCHGDLSGVTDEALAHGSTGSDDAEGRAADALGEVDPGAGQ